MVDNDFVLVDPNMEKRPSRLNRQIEEAIYNIRPEDYNEEGDLKEVEVEDDLLKSSADFPPNKDNSNINQNLFEVANTN